MSDTTLTNESVDAADDLESLSAAESETKAEVETEETQTDPIGTDETVEATAETDPDLEWAKSLGIDPSDPDALKKAVKIARDNQRTARESQKKAADLRQLTEGQTDDDPQVRALTYKVTEMEFFQQHPEAKGHEDELIKVGQDYPELARAFNLTGLWEIAKGRRADASLTEAEKKGREAERADIARKSTATMPKGNASGTAPTEKDVERDAFRKALGL